MNTLFELLTWLTETYPVAHSTLHSVFSVLSLASTIPVVWGSFGLLTLLTVKAFIALAKTPADRTHIEWIYIGIWFTFCASLIDNSYWWKAWDSDYFARPDRDFWFHNGVFSNLPFRQMFTAYSVYAHFRAFMETDEIKFKLFVTWAWYLAIIYAGYLFAYHPETLPLPT